jgi:hypothetical protein
MNDDELITAVQDSVTNVHMTIPAEQITSRSREIRARRRRSGLSGALAVIVATAVAVTVLPGHGTRSAPILTVRLLADRAAAAALSRPEVRPGQWVYREIKWRLSQDVRRPVGTEATWTTASGKQAYVGDAYLEVAIGALPYSKLGSLPSDPAVLEKYLGDQPLVPGLAFTCLREATHQVVKCPPPSLPPHMTPIEHATIAFRQIQGMLWKYVLPPRLAAALFHALADVPGITVLRNATDIAGQHGVAFVLPHARWPMSSASRFGSPLPMKGLALRLELILNPHNYRLMAMSRTMKYSQTPHERVTTFDQEAIIRQAFVARPGVLP